MIIKLHNKPQAKYAPALLISYYRPILLGLVIFITISYFFFDRPIAYYFHGNVSSFEGLAEFVSDVMNPFTLLIAIPILYFLNRSFWKKDKLTEPLKLLVFALPFSFLITKIFKFILGRYRPKSLFSEGLYGFHFIGSSSSEFSFPSGHACMIGAIMGVIALYRPKYTLHLIAVGIVLSFSRVVEGDHFLSDVVAGVILGSLVSQLLYVLMKKQKIQF